jgi:phenylalanyl-tRNA synthetase alpha subunit
MRFFKRGSKLETLTEKLKLLNDEINTLQAQIKDLTSDGDPVIRLILKERLGIDYKEERSRYEAIIDKKKQKITVLEKEKQRLQPQIQEAAFQEELNRKGIHFEGEDVAGYVGSVVKIRCSHCGHRFSQDLRSNGAFNNVWLCSTETALNQIHSMKFNKIWPFSCQKCKSELDIWVLRDKL